MKWQCIFLLLAQTVAVAVTIVYPEK